MSKKDIAAQNSDFIDPNSDDFPETAEPETGLPLSKSTKTLSSFSTSEDTIDDSSMNEATTTKKSFLDFSSLSKKQKVGMSVLAIFLLILSILGTLGVYTYTVAQEIKVQASVASQLGSEAYALFKTQNLHRKK